MIQNGRTSVALRASYPTYWLIARNSTGRSEVLTAWIGGEEALLVFSFEDEARLFFHFEGLDTGWRVRETAIEEMVRVLFEPQARTRRVALDPLPVVLGGDINPLVGLEREEFARCLLHGA